MGKKDFLRILLAFLAGILPVKRRPVFYVCYSMVESVCPIFFLRFIVFVTYQMYYEYPPPTYLEYPILIAQGEFQNQNTASPGGTSMLVVTVKSITWNIISSGLSLPLHWQLPNTCFNILHKNLAKKKIWSRSKWPLIKPVLLYLCLWGSSELDVLFKV